MQGLQRIHDMLASMGSIYQFEIPIQTPHEGSEYVPLPYLLLYL